MDHFQHFVVDYLRSTISILSFHLSTGTLMTAEAASVQEQNYAVIVGKQPQGSQRSSSEEQTGASVIY